MLPYTDVQDIHIKCLLLGNGKTYEVEKIRIGCILEASFYAAHEDTVLK